MAKTNYMDKTAATWLITKVKAALGGKVDKDGAKVLSDNNYSNKDKNKLKGVAENAQVNVLETVRVNNTELVPKAKTVNIDLTSYAKSSEIIKDNKNLTNGAGYQTASDVETIVTSKGYQTAANVNTIIGGKGYQTADNVNTIINGKGYQTSSQVEAAITDAIAGFTGIDFHICTDGSLPASGQKGTIYLLANGGAGNNGYDEYIWLTNKFEKIGSTDVDLSQYAKTADFVAIDTTELNNMWNTL